MLTPIDIQNKEFARSVRGYKEEEVDAFLDLITADFDQLLKENATLQLQLLRTEEDLKRYKSSEGAVLETLEAAKALMGDISASAEKRAEILLKNAELDAQLISREAKDSVQKLTEESLQLRTRLTAFQAKFRNLLESELERFDTLSMELFADFGVENLREDSISRPKKAFNVSSGTSASGRADYSKADLSKTMVVKIKE